MKRVGQITYEFSEEEYKKLNENIEEVDDFLKGFAKQARADVAVDNIKRILKGEDD